MLPHFFGPELAVAHMRLRHFRDVSLESPVRLVADGTVKPLREAARALHRPGLVVRCRARAMADVLEVTAQALSEEESVQHVEGLDEELAEDRRQYGERGPAGEALVIGVRGAVLGETSWNELHNWQAGFAGDAWGGGLSGPLAHVPLSAGYAITVDLSASGSGVFVEAEDGAGAG